MDEGRHAWKRRGACAIAVRRGEVDPDAFFPSAGDPGEVRRACARAQAYCERCPVLAECLADALATGDDYGVRGGVPGHQRVRMRQEIRRAEHEARKSCRASAVA